MEEQIIARIERARWLLANARNAAMATVNVDGSPHNTPFFFIHDEQLEYVYWSSFPGSLHCHNALRTGEIFVVLYESNAGGGLYITADNSEELAGEEVAVALSIQNKLRAREQKEALTADYYSDKSLQRMYRARPTHFFVNAAERDASGTVTRDYRHEISRTDLTAT